MRIKIILFFIALLFFASIAQGHQSKDAIVVHITDDGFNPKKFRLKLAQS